MALFSRNFFLSPWGLCIKEAVIFSSSSTLASLPFSIGCGFICSLAIHRSMAKAFSLIAASFYPKATPHFWTLSRTGKIFLSNALSALLATSIRLPYKVQPISISVLFVLSNFLCMFLLEKIAVKEIEPKVKIKKISLTTTLLFQLGGTVLLYIFFRFSPFFASSPPLFLHIFLSRK